MHSLNFRVLCLVIYTFNEEMRFYCVSDEKCLSRSQADKLRREFMALLQNQALADHSVTEISRMSAAVGSTMCNS
jgi:hypothetical protein